MLDKNARGYQPSSAYASTAVDQNFVSGLDAPMDFRAVVCPALLKSLIRNIDVTNRQMNPVHVELSNRLTLLRDLKKFELMIFNQGYNAACSPVADNVQIIIKAPVPAVRQILFAGAECEAKNSIVVAEMHFSDAQGG